MKQHGELECGAEMPTVTQLTAHHLVASSAQHEIHQKKMAEFDSEGWVTLREVT